MMPNNTGENGLINSKKKVGIKDLLRDYFDFVVWEATSQIFTEIGGHVPREKIKIIQEEIWELFHNSFVELMDPPEFRENLCRIHSKQGITNHLICEYIVETLAIFRTRLTEIFPEEDLVKGVIDEEVFQNLNNIIDEYVLISYFDKIILNDVIRIILYSSKISYAEVNEFRIHLLELFKDSLEGKSSIKNINDYIRSEMIRLSVPLVINDFITSCLFGYFSVILKNQDHRKMIEIMKNSVRKLILIPGDLTFIEKDKIDMIIDWIVSESVVPYLELLSSYSNANITPSLPKLEENVRSLFTSQLKRKKPFESILNEIEELQNSIIITYSKTDVKDSDNLYKKLSNKFIRNADSIKVERDLINDQKKYSDNYEETTDLLFLTLKYLVHVIDEEMSHDFKLDELIQIIKDKKLNTTFDMMYL